MSSRANSFGTFLQTMNAGKQDPVVGFDREASAKLALVYLSQQKGPTSQTDLGRSLGVTEDQCRQVVAYLEDAGMVEQIDNNKLKLSGFGNDALGVFSVT